MEIRSILDQIDFKNYALPEFQRGYVWNRDQVRKLMNSLYRGYPVGSLLVWVTGADPDLMRGDTSAVKDYVHLILDGQQRITSLYGIIRGTPPPFFDGDHKAFTGLYFNVEEEIFEFYRGMKMDNDPSWVNVTELMQTEAGNYVEQRPELLKYLSKLNAISNILKIDLPIQIVSGEDKTVDVVVDIFNNVNSGGTKLRQGDLALAKLCAEVPETRKELRDVLNYFKAQGFSFKMEWLLRCITVYLTSKPYFSGLTQSSATAFVEAIPVVRDMVGSILDQMGSRLGLDHDRVLQSKFAFPVIIEYLKRSGEKTLDNTEWNQIFYWYIHTFLWGRYSGSVESNLAQDLNTLDAGEGIDGLIGALRRSRGDLTITPEDFIGWSRGSRFYPLMYLMCRTEHSIDWLSGVELSDALLGKNASLELHHIFPKARLYDHGYSKSLVNALANFAFLTKGTNLEISNKSPEAYMPEILAKQPYALQSQWIPQNPELWKIENYEVFLKKRRILLANAANDVLDRLRRSDQAGNLRPAQEISIKHLDLSSGLDDEESAILEFSLWMEENGLDPGEFYCEIVSEKNGQTTILDLAWPDGIQEGLSEPMALLLNGGSDDYQLLSNLGYVYFSTIDRLKVHVESNYLVSS